MHAALLGALLLTTASAEQMDVDLLVVGGSESGVAAAVQAARLGVESIALVNDIDWLGGQFTAEGLGAVDEWTIYKGRRDYYPRSGLFLEIMTQIEADMLKRYGIARPGNSFCAWTTCEPQATEQLFRRLVAPYLTVNGGPLTIVPNYEPAHVQVESGKVAGVEFVSTTGDRPPLVIRARLTIDASDWGDVIRLSGAGHMSGPDLKAEFHEPGAPETYADVHKNEMNPLTYCLVLRESLEPTVISEPPNYDVRRYLGATAATAEEYKTVGWPKQAQQRLQPAWRDSEMPNGPYNEPPTVYTHRRLVDRRHNNLPIGTEAVLVNWPVQDYPTYDFPAYLVEQLEATEPGASQRNLVDMTPAQRRLVFEDAKHHALGLLYYLQTIAYERVPDTAVSFRDLKLTDEFGTADQLPWKPYVREGLRLKALYVLREQDLRDTDGIQSWAEAMVPDNVFGFQFNIDFHPTRRIFLDDDPAGPWTHIHSSYRHWGTHTDRAGFPLRSLIPAEMDGLLAAGKNLGYTSIVSSAVRLHGHGMLVGQASATLAAECLKHHLAPRELARDWSLIRELQTLLLEPPEDPFTHTVPPGVLLWPYHDLPPGADHFVAANQLALRSILPGGSGLQDFEANRTVKRRELARAVIRAALSTGKQAGHEYATRDSDRTFADMDFIDPDFPAVESLVRWNVLPSGERFGPDEPATWADAREVFTSMDWPFKSPVADESIPLTRAQWSVLLWQAIRGLPEKVRSTGESYLEPGADQDGDGLADLDDPLPFDADNDSLPDRLDPDSNNDGIADGIEFDRLSLRRFNFTGLTREPLPGYINDTGETFDPDRGFGWNRSLTGQNRRRGAHPDPALDTFLFVRKTARWECAVPNGQYRVTVTVGDAGHDQPGQRVCIEGIPVLENGDTLAGEFRSTTATVSVTDGRLTVDIGTEDESLNTCLNTIEVEGVRLKEEG